MLRVYTFPHDMVYREVDGGGLGGGGGGGGGLGLGLVIIGNKIGR